MERKINFARVISV